MKLPDLQKFAAVAKESGIVIEVVEDGRTIRFHPNFAALEDAECPQGFNSFDWADGLLVPKRP